MTVTQTFVVQAIAPDVVARLRLCDDAGRPPTVVVDQDGGSPVRCCLRLSRPGERLLLASYAPLRRWAAGRGADPAAYDEVGPVFVHPNPCDGPVDAGYPDELRGASRVLRAYDGTGRIVGGRLLQPTDEPERALTELLDDDSVVLVHARAVVFGCFTFAVERRHRSTR